MQLNVEMHLGFSLIFKIKKTLLYRK